MESNIKNLTLSSGEIKKILVELEPIIKNSKIFNIYQPREKELILEIRNYSKNYYVFISVKEREARIHLISKKKKSPLKPFNFVQYLRAKIKSGIIEECFYFPERREIDFQIKKDQIYLLKIFIHGGNGNIFLSDDEKTYSMLKRSKITDFLTMPPMNELRGLREEFRIFPGESINAIVENYFDGITQKSYIDFIKREIERNILSIIKKHEKLLHKLKKSQNDEGSDLLKQKGELLKIHINDLKKGMPEIVLEDTNTKKGIKIKLNPKLKPVENMELYFKKYKKKLKTSFGLKKRIEEIENDIKIKQDILIKMNNILSQKTQNIEKKLSEYYFELIKQGIIRRRKQEQREKEEKKYRIINSHDNFKIIVGRNDMENDYITFRLANGNDIWLHAAGVPGSHVVIKIPKDKSLTEESLLDAATLAAHYSKLKKSNGGNVSYTYRKYVFKPKGLPPGKVYVTNTKEIRIKINKKRLNFLLSQLNINS